MTILLHAALLVKTWFVCVAFECVSLACVASRLKCDVGKPTQYCQGAALVRKQGLAQAQEGSLHHRIVCVKSVVLFSTHSSVMAVRSSGVFDTSVAARAGEHEGRV